MAKFEEMEQPIRLGARGRRVPEWENKVGRRNSSGLSLGMGDARETSGCWWSGGYGHFGVRGGDEGLRLGIEASFVEDVAHQFFPGIFAIAGDVFVFDAGVRLEHESAEIGEDGGALGRDSVGGERKENGGKGLIDVGAGIHLPGERSDLAGEVVFDVSFAGGRNTEVGEAESVFGNGHTAEAAIGKLKMAKVVGRVLSSRGHRIILDE